MTFSSKIFRPLVAGAAMSLLLASAAAAQENMSRSVDDLDWVQGGPGLAFALVWGDWTKDDYGMIVKIDAGVTAPRHAHTFDYHGLSIQGNWVHTFGENDTRSMTPGGYIFQPGGEDHGDRCDGAQDCLIYIHQHGPRDFIPEGN